MSNDTEQILIEWGFHCCLVIYLIVALIDQK